MENGATTEEAKMRLILKGLKGKANTWFTMYIEAHANTKFIKADRADTQGEWLSYKDFIGYLKQCHGLHDDPKEKAQQELLTIKQGPVSTLQYNQEFDRLLCNCWLRI